MVIRFIWVLYSPSSNYSNITGHWVALLSLMSTTNMFHQDYKSAHHVIMMTDLQYIFQCKMAHSMLFPPAKITHHGNSFGEITKCSEIPPRVFDDINRNQGKTGLSTEYWWRQLFDAVTNNAFEHSCLIMVIKSEINRRPIKIQVYLPKVTQCLWLIINIEQSFWPGAHFTSKD